MRDFRFKIKKKILLTPLRLISIKFCKCNIVYKKFKVLFKRKAHLKVTMSHSECFNKGYINFPLNNQQTTYSV